MCCLAHWRGWNGEGWREVRKGSSENNWVLMTWLAGSGTELGGGYLYKVLSGAQNYKEGILSIQEMKCSTEWMLIIYSLQQRIQSNFNILKMPKKWRISGSNSSGNILTN
jgi:hypothetical protein